MIDLSFLSLPAWLHVMYLRVSNTAPLWLPVVDRRLFDGQVVPCVWVDDDDRMVSLHRYFTVLEWEQFAGHVAYELTCGLSDQFGIVARAVRCALGDGCAVNVRVFHG